MDKIRFGVIGLGWFGEMHCEALAGIPHIELTALCTRTESRLQQFAERFGVTRTYTDYRDLLDDDQVDAVCVVTMWDQHREPAVASLEAGKHVFLEKPMASSVEDCQAIVDASSGSTGNFMVGHICRFNPRYAAAKQEIAEGKIGKVISLSSRRNIPAAITPDILNKIGPIIGDGIHDTDLMLWYTQSKVVSAYAQTVEIRGLKYPDLGMTMYRFDSGAVATLETVWCLPEKTPFAIDERMEIIGTEGAIHIHDTVPNYSIYNSEGWRFPDTTYWPELHGRRAGALRDELSYFATCIQEGRQPDIITAKESMAAVRACLAAEQSAATGEVVRLK